MSSEAELERAQIDAEIHDLHLAITVLRRKRNALAPISQLSTDVLLTVFDYLQFPPNGETEGILHPFICRYSNLHSQLSWIQEMTHVCAEWRYLALSTRRLWSRIKLMDPFMTLEMLERSRESPIDVIFQLENVQPENENSLQHMLNKHFGRIRHLEISTTPHMRLHTLSHSLRSCPPNVLQAFSFAVDSSTEWLPVELLKRSSGSLRYLSLSRVLVRGLESTTEIKLPHLDLLSLYQEPSKCAALLDKVRIPATCFVSLWCWDNSLVVTSSTLHPFISRYWEDRGSVGKPLTFIRIQPFPEISIRSSTSMEILLSDTRITRRGSDPEGMILRFEGTSFSIHSTTILRGILGCLPLVRVTTMIIDYDTPLPSFWKTLSESCPNIRHLTIGGADPTAFLRTLSPPPTTTGGSQLGNFLSSLGSSGKVDPPLVFPELQELSFYETPFQDEDARNLLFAGLKYRSKKKAPLRRLAFYAVLGLSDEYFESVAGFIWEEVYIGKARRFFFRKDALS